jgi:transcriptional regulator with XRE-family HTH domain
MNFEDLQLRLLDHLRDRVRRGDLTERGLARVSGISQPHIHNVLKGKRSLSPESSDAILHNLRLDLRDLIPPETVKGAPPTNGRPHREDNS